jgi:hypothetical protein
LEWIVGGKARWQINVSSARLHAREVSGNKGGIYYKDKTVI